MRHELETLIRAGHLSEARSRLQAYSLASLSRGELLDLANLARRVGLASLALRALAPTVRSKKPMARPATAHEKLEYAASLRNMGAVREAAEILKSLSGEMLPEASFHLALCYFTEWRYREAIPLLREHSRNEKATPYSRLVSKVNLLEAHIAEEQPTESAATIEEIEKEFAESSEHRLARYKFAELKAQNEIFARRDYARASALLKDARNEFESTASTAATLLMEKWLAISQSLATGQVQPQLAGVRERALAAGEWETVRDCDYHSARLQSDIPTLNHLYFGTPHEFYRRRILNVRGEESLPEKWLWFPDGPKREPGIWLDLETGEIRNHGGRTTTLNTGKSLHRLLIVLCRDFYKPVPLITLFSQLFPDEYFDVETSAERVHQILSRLRAWLRTEISGLSIEEIDGTYRIRSKGSVALALPLEPLPLDRSEIEFRLLRLRFGEMNQNEFTASQALSIVGGSKSTIRLLLNWAIENGKLAQSGQGRSSKYKVAA